MPLGHFCPGRRIGKNDGEPENRPEDMSLAVPRGVGVASENVRLLSAVVPGLPNPACPFVPSSPPAPVPRPMFPHVEAEWQDKNQ